MLAFMISSHCTITYGLIIPKQRTFGKNSFLLGCLVAIPYKGFERFRVVAFSVEPKLAFSTGPAAAISAGPEQSPRRFENQFKTTWADMKKETGFYLKSSLYFPEKSGSVRILLPLLREKGGWHLRKTLVLFWPPECQKPRNILGF